MTDVQEIPAPVFSATRPKRACSGATSRRARVHAIAAGIALAFIAVVATASDARAQDATRQARAFYKEGTALFQAGDYAGAVSKFKAADQLAPAPLLDFNIGLAYDRLGNRAQALRHYRSYLRRAPSAKNAAAVKAKINRIDGEMRAEAARERDRKKAEAVAEAKREHDEEEAAAARAATPPPTSDAVPAPVVPETGGAASDGDVPPVANDRITATRAPTDAERAPAVAPAAPMFEPTGDPELDRVGAIDVSALRSQRGLASDRRTPVGNQNAAVGANRAGASGQYGAKRQPLRPVDSRDKNKKKSKPAYKQWWFWVVVGVSAVILIDVLSTDSGTTRNAQIQPVGLMPGTSAAGPAVFRF